MPKEITVSACLFETLKGGSAPLAKREGDGTVRMAPPDFPDEGGEKVVGVKRILAALQNKGAKPKPISLIRTCENFLGGKMVS